MSLPSVIGVVGLAILVTVYALLFIRRGREYRTPGLEHYLIDVDELELPPALVGYVWRMGHMSSHDISATILDLIDRGLISLDDPIRPRRLLLPACDGGALMAHEKVVLSLLNDAARGDHLLVRDLAEFADREPERFMRRMVEFKEAVVAWANAFGVFERGGERWARVALAISWVTCVWTLVCSLAARNAWLLLGVPVSALMIVFAQSMWRRSRRFADIRNRAEALCRYLKDFGRMADKPAGAVAVWSRYLVFAEEFGIAGRVREQLLCHAGEQVGLFGSLTFVLDTMPVLPLPHSPGGERPGVGDDRVAAS